MVVIIYGHNGPDRKPDGTIRSMIPAWASRAAFDNLKEEVQDLKTGMEMGLITPSEQVVTAERIKMGEKRIREINDSRPKLSPEQRDFLAKERERAGKQITNTMFTRSDMEMGFARPDKELEKWIKPTIEIDPEQAKESGIVLVNGRTGLDGAKKYYSDLSYALDEDPDPERRRRSGEKVQYVPLTQEVPAYDQNKLPEYYQDKTKVEVPEVKANSTFEHKGIEVQVNRKKGGRPKGSKNKPKK